ncbi:MAG: metalloregulator ArsR/SmtB family transcription factor [Clostridia bacterium]|nr:metalloregulator ArsR/SmtB family transcription factor [Clostridia bacterium]
MTEKLFHCQHAAEAKSKIPNDILCSDIADFFKIFGDLTRIKILFAISEKPLCVHDLALILGMTQSAVSHQLKTLRHYKLVKIERDGRLVFYVIDDEHIAEILSAGQEHLQHKTAKRRAHDD